MEHLQNYCLRWNNYQTNLVKVFDEMLKNENFTDVTIVTENSIKFKCHKMILAACSKFFQDIFINVPSEQHLVVLLKDVNSRDMSHILEYMYTGQVNVEQGRLSSIIRTAEELQIKGLIGDEKPPKREDEEMRDYQRSRTPSNHVPTVVHSSSHVHSPPHSTNAIYKNPYANMYHKVYHHERANMNLPIWNVPGLPLPATSSALENSPSTHFPAPSPPSMAPPYEQPDVYHHRRKKFSSGMMPKDTPILRTVLGQGQDLQHPVGHVVTPADVKQENGNQESLNKHTETEQRPEDIQCSEDCPTEDDVKSRLIAPTLSPHDMRLVSSGIAKYAKHAKGKRYKQYSHKDLNGAIADVVTTGVSALAAAKRYKVPSRTLYDKVKKLKENGTIIGKPKKSRSTSSPPANPMPDEQSVSPRPTSENEEFPMNNNAAVTNAILQHAGQDALKVMAFAAALQNSNHVYMPTSPSSPQMRYMPYNRVSPRCSTDSDNHSESPLVEKDLEENQVEDLSMKRQEGVIVSPQNQPMKEEPLDDAYSPYSNHHSPNGEDVKPNIAVSAPLPHSLPKELSVIKSGLVDYVPVQKPEWKRYKQYSKENLNSAIQSVAEGLLSALQAAKKYKIPSRTLYDKIKKLGIITGRSINKRRNSGYRYIPNEQIKSPCPKAENEEASINNNSQAYLQQAIDSQDGDALKAMAMVAAYHMAATHNGQQPGFQHGPPSALLQYIQHMQSRSPSMDEDQLSDDDTNTKSDREEDMEFFEDQVQDLSLNNRQGGVIVSPMHQVTAIAKTEDVTRETQEE